VVRVVGALVCLVLTGLVSPGAVAQDATPAVELVTPDPADCRVEPRTVENLMAFVATPQSGLASPASRAATPDAAVVPEGSPADAATVAGVTATARELYACYNANAFLRVFALFTDSYMARSFVAEGITAEAVKLLGTSIPPQAKDDWMSVGVQDVRVRSDGRIGAFLVSRNPMGGDTTSTDYYIFVERDGRYLIDAVVLSVELGR
jgi:hypothetical protein